MQATTQLTAKNIPPVEFPSHTGAKGNIIQAILAPATLGAPDAKAVGQQKQSIIE
jgi:hypothetical protein